MNHLKNFKNHKGVSGNLSLPESAVVEVYKATEAKTVLHNTTVKTNIGDVRNFTIGNQRFVASYSNGEFKGYFNSKSGDQYFNPEINIKDGGSFDKKMNLTFQISNAGEKASAQAIQIVETTIAIDGPKYHSSINDQPSVGFVDGGRNSPGAQKSGNIGKEANPGLPYYINENLTLSNGTVGSTGFVINGSNLITINIYDRPGLAFTPLSTTNFQTIIVATNFYGSGQNVVMGVYDWGFKNSNLQTYPTHSRNSFEFTSIKASSINILKTDYSKFKLKF